MAPSYATQYRTRDAHDPNVWGWGDKAEAYIFESLARPVVSSPLDYEKSAEVHVERLRADGEAHCHAVTWTAGCALERAKKREGDRIAGTLAGAEAAGLIEPVTPGVPVAKGSTIPERIRKARAGRRRGFRRGRSAIDPGEVYRREEERGLA